MALSPSHWDSNSASVRRDYAAALDQGLQNPDPAQVRRLADITALMPTGEFTETVTPPPPSAETAHYLASGAHNGFVQQQLGRLTRQAAEYTGTTLEFRRGEQERFTGPAMELILQAYAAAPNLRHLALPQPEGGPGHIEHLLAQVQPRLENYPALLSITMGDIRLERPAAGQPFARRDPPQS